MSAMPSRAEERRERVKRDLDEILNSLLAAQAKLPALVSSVRDMLAMVEPQEEADAGDAEQDEAGAQAEERPDHEAQPAERK